jgi:hypothetical protein
MQLHRLLTAKGSTEMSEENKKQGIFLPQVAETAVRAVGKRHLGIHSRLIGFR